MSDRLTAAGEALVRRLTTRDTQDNRPYEATIRAIEAEAAARAVDEALSVRKVADALVACAPWVESAGDAWHVQVWLDEDVMRIFEDGSFAAALVTHLTKKEETHD